MLNLIKSNMFTRKLTLEYQNSQCGRKILKKNSFFSGRLRHTTRAFQTKDVVVNHLVTYSVTRFKMQRLLTKEMYRHFLVRWH